MNDSVIVVFCNNATGQKCDVEIPTNISVKNLIIGLNEAFGLGIDVRNSSELYLRTENPIGILAGDIKVCDCNIYTGTEICFDARK